MKLLTLLLTMISLGAHAADLGKEIVPAKRGDGKPAFGVQYAASEDADHSAYMVTLTPNLSPTETSQDLLWNFYVNNEPIREWMPTIKTPMATLQVVEAIPALVQRLIDNQAKSVHLVFADPLTFKPLYSLSLTRMCKEYPKHFKDLNSDKNCGE